MLPPLLQLVQKLPLRHGSEPGLVQDKEGWPVQDEAPEEEECPHLRSGVAVAGVVERSLTVFLVSAVEGFTEVAFQLGHVPKKT